MTNLPSGWISAEISELFYMVGGGTPSTANQSYWGAGWPWITSADIDNSNDYAARKHVTAKGVEASTTNVVPADAVLVVTRVGLGKAAIAKEELCFSQDLQGLTAPKNAIYPRFALVQLTWLLNSLKYEGRGTTINGLTKAQLKSTKFLLPPFNEQRRIVEKIEAMFDEIDAGIQSLQTARTTLSLYRQSLLKSAFEGRLTADWRAQNEVSLEAPKTLLACIQSERDTRYKSALDAWQDALAAWRAGGEKGKKPAKPKRLSTFPDELNDLQIALPELPFGWRWAHLGWCSSGPEYGTAAKSSDNGEVPVIRMGNLQRGRIDWDNLAYTSDPKEIQKYSLKAGDVLFNRTNSPELVGKTSIYKGDRPAVFAGYLVRVNQIEKITSASYLTYFLNSPIASEHGQTVKTDGVNQSNINASKLQEYPFPYCSPAEQAEIVRRLDARLEAADALGAEIDAALTHADALRQSILKKAFSGQLVPQDPEDQPAAELLERIKAERATSPKHGGEGRVTV